MSVDGIGAFDLVSRESMLAGLARVRGGPSALPFVRQFYVEPSVFWWEDDEGKVHDIVQGEGGEQGDPFMPALYSLGQHEALAATQETLERDSSLSWTTSTRFLSSSALQQSMQLSNVKCGGTQASGCIWERPKFGTRVTFSQRGASLWCSLEEHKIPPWKCGEEVTSRQLIRVSKSLELRLGTVSSWSRS